MAPLHSKEHLTFPCRSRINESERAQPGCIGGRAERNYEKERGGSEKEKEKSKGDVKKEEKVKAKSEKERKEEEARRRRLQNAKKAPPPIDFQSLLEMANHKKDIPVKVQAWVLIRPFFLPSKLILVTFIFPTSSLFLSPLFTFSEKAFPPPSPRWRRRKWRRSLNSGIVP